MDAPATSSGIAPKRSARGGSWLRSALVYGLALAAGVGSAIGFLKTMPAFGQGQGPWRASMLAGSQDADLYTRAQVAIGGLLALNRSETMYYLARTDSQGDDLRSRCTYRIHGTPPKARWWSITAYAEDIFLFPNEQRRYSLNGDNAALDAQGRFNMVTAPSQPASAPGTWVPTPGDRGLILTLRLYNPDAAMASDPGQLLQPRIERVGDCP